MNVSRSLPLGALALALPVLLLWHCAHDAVAPASSGAASAANGAPAPTSASPPANAAPAPKASAEPAPSTAPTPMVSTGSDAPTAPSAAPSPAGSRITAAVANSDQRDLALLMRIERELKRDPPAAVHELVRQRKAGASREALLAGARQLPENDLPLRVLVLRWVDEVSPAPGAAPATKPAVPTSSASGHSLVGPIQPTAKP